MRCPDKTADEAARLGALAEYGLGLDAELPGLDPIVDIAAQMFECPVAAVNIIGEEHVFLVSRHGIDEYDNGRDVSFCAHTINQNGVMVVEDATLDPRFHDNPMVTGGFIQFYAGVPLRTAQGLPLGALCVIDTKPRTQFGEDDQTRLRELASLVSDRLELRRLEIASAAGISRLEASAATSPNAVVCFDEKRRITAWNAAATTMFRRSAEEALGRSFDELIAKGDRSAVREAIDGVLAGGAPKSDATELSAIRSDGEIFPAEIYCSRWLEGDKMHFGASVRDMTERRRERDALYYLANFDRLTGLANRNLLYERIEEALAQGKYLALIVTDLDGLADINNTLGHAACDSVLYEVGRRLVRVVPSSALVARLGSDLFGTFLTGATDPLILAEVARTINAALAEPIVVDGHEVRIVGNCGIALAPAHGGTAEELAGSANLALFQARSEARGGSYMFTPALRAEAVARRMYDAELHRAFEREEFVLFYQPQYRLADGALVGAEALIRWKHPERGLLAPSAFLPALEAGVLADRVGRWVLETVCAQAAQWRAIQPDLHIAANLFAAQFRPGDIAPTLLAMVEEHGMVPGAIELEITENIILDQQDRVLAQLHELCDAGFTLAFDDFGTGYASLTMLRNFPVACIKIDKSFIQVVRTSNKDRAIVQSLIDLARQLGMHVIAEGVESAGDCEFLRARGCERGQGYFFGMPVPAGLFEERFLTDGERLRQA